MLTPGIYRLTETVANPTWVDRRRTGPWDSTEYKEGTLFVVSFMPNDLVPEVTETPRLGIQGPAGVWNYRHLKRAQLLVDAMTPYLEKVDHRSSSDMLLLYYREVLEGVGSYRSLVQALLHDGIISLHDVERVLQKLSATKIGLG